MVCWKRWWLEPDCYLAPIKNDTIKAKAAAEKVANGPIYVVTDNDCLILGKNFVKRGIEVMERHSEFGLLAATSISDGDYPSGSDWLHEPEVIEKHSVGGIAFVRKGILTEFNKCDPTRVDDTICSEMNRKGYKTGSMPAIRFNHIGAGYSISNPLWWMQVP